ncbi:FAD:protein FMN transferase [Naumannella sp. ID2617S]|nr:FAD:protein FMN transferase [Naumannella sp. ID2617S]
MSWHSALWHGPLGTWVELQVDTDDDAVVDRAETTVLTEIDRLTAICSQHDPGSELSRWRRGEAVGESVEMVALLELAERWYHRSNGLFHPALGKLRARWCAAEHSGVPPAREELAELAATTTLPFTVTDGRVERTGDCTGVDLYALSKGWVVDRAAAAVLAQPGVRAVVLNAGGDLVHRGAGQTLVALEDPAQPFDNAPPVAVVAVSEAALATSGAARRGFIVGDAWYGHVLDPWTGWPIASDAQVSVLAADAVTADVAATIIGVGGIASAPAGVEWLVATDRGHHASPGWPIPSPGTESTQDSHSSDF